MLCDYVHRPQRHEDVLHSCGSIYRLMPDLIEAGYDVINPVQTVTQDMEPERLKREFGRDITFWGGGMNTRAVLNHAAAAGRVRLRAPHDRHLCAGRRVCVQPGAQRDARRAAGKPGCDVPGVAGRPFSG
jgi:hypothetical protein